MVKKPAGKATEDLAPRSPELEKLEETFKSIGAIRKTRGEK